MANIRDLRKAARLSQYALASKANISRMRLSLVECGYAKLDPADEKALRDALADAVTESVKNLSDQLKNIAPEATVSD